MELADGRLVSGSSDGTIKLWLAEERELVAALCCELARERETETGSAVTPRSQGIGLGELLEQFRLLLGRRPDAGV